jgi:uncharacterized protein
MPLHFRFLAALFTLFGLFATPLLAQNTKPTLDEAVAALPESAQPADAPAEAQAKQVRATPALWMVRDDDTTVYLFGTLHLMTLQIDWFHGPVRAAYGAATEVVTELGVVDEAAIAQSLMAIAANKDGPPLTPELTEAQKLALESALAKSGMPARAADAFKPWFTAMVLTVAPLKQLGFDPKLGVDATIQNQAKVDNKPVIGLETAEQQFALFDSLPRALQIQLLTSTVDEADKLAGRVDVMVNQWSTGDADAIAAMLNTETAASADLGRILLTERNARWAEWIKARLEKPGIIFMAVGAGHLAGKGSVQEALAGHGIASERLVNP